MQTLTEQYDRWIKKVVRSMYNKYHKYYAYEDLLSVAYIASLESEKNYNPDKAKFSAFIRPRIEGAITRAVSNITDSQHKILIEMYKFIDMYTDKHGRIPAQHIILSHLKLTESQFLAILDTTIRVKLVSTDDICETELSTNLDLDTIVEFSKVEDIINTLTKDQQNKISNFLGNPNASEEKIKDILAILRNRLNIEENV
jgi:DNA-directed RNA polymerase specialized sigma subunit